MITGINHITLAVRDIELSFTFYNDIMGLKPLARWPQGAYFLAGDVWLALVVDPHTRTETLPEYTHLAFSISPEDLPQFCQKIKAANIEIWQDNKTEGDSLYFVDPNGHKLEIHVSNLDTRLKTAKADPWPGLEFFD
jgi:catechol 2,3-dioxygenase-like lactoylglutathione lyase family enzyme